MGRTEEAVAEVEAGLARGASPGKSYNILGILLASQGQKELALRAFANAARSELALGSLGQVATPLNNSGEVYREIFREDQAETAWLTALSRPDGCDHVLPSLNTAILSIEKLRLFAADRALKDFQACFAEKSERKDSEHKSLLALIKGRTLLRIGKVDEALAHLEVANSATQWFGRIGTNEDDLKLAAKTTLADALEAKRATLKTHSLNSWREWFGSKVSSTKMGFRVWWLRRGARILAVDNLNDFEDMLVRHSDSMLEYPTIGRLLSGFSNSDLVAKINQLKLKDSREGAHNHYDLYLGTQLASRGKRSEAKAMLSRVLSRLRPHDSLLRAETITQLLRNNEGSLSEADRNKMLYELFTALPSAVRYQKLPLPAYD